MNRDDLERAVYRGTKKALDDSRKDDGLPPFLLFLTFLAVVIMVVFESIQWLIDHQLGWILVILFVILVNKYKVLLYLLAFPFIFLEVKAVYSQTGSIFLAAAILIVFLGVIRRVRIVFNLLMLLFLLKNYLPADLLRSLKSSDLPKPFLPLDLFDIMMWSVIFIIFVLEMAKLVKYISNGNFKDQFMSRFRRYKDLFKSRLGKFFI